MRIAAALGTATTCALLALSVSACGGTPSPAASGPVAQCTANQITVSPNLGSAPTVTLPKNCSTPTKLLSRDIVTGTGTGTGPAVKKGDTISADYQLTTWSNDKMVQQSFGEQPFSAPIGVGQVIPGWDQGLIGEKAGGRRLLVIPPALGYGSVGQQGIKPNETLVFVVDVHSITPAS